MPWPASIRMNSVRFPLQALTIFCAEKHRQFADAPEAPETTTPVANTPQASEPPSDLKRMVMIVSPSVSRRDAARYSSIESYQAVWHHPFEKLHADNAITPVRKTDYLDAKR